MPTIKDTAATSALNEDKYINKLYDETLKKQQGTLTEHRDQNAGALNEAQQSVQQQTQVNLDRTQVEAEKMNGQHKQPGGAQISSGASAQAGLSQWNQQAADRTNLQGKQQAADAEIERRRKLLATQYEAAIKKAQAENDMQRAQQLYEAAKKEDAQLLELRKQAASMLAGKGDNSILDEIAAGKLPARDTTSETWEGVLKNEADLNKIYAAQEEAKRQELAAEYEKGLVEMEAKRQLQTAQTDQALTNAYVDGLRKARNYAEVQTAYGQGTGLQQRAQLAQDMALQKELTRLRGVQMGAGGQLGLERAALGQKFRDALAKSQAEVEAKRLGALYEAAEKEEQTLIDNQKFVGNELAKQNDYSVLGKLMGLTQDQIDRLQGTGAYGGSGDGGSGGGRRGGGGGSSGGSASANKDLTFGDIGTAANKIAQSGGDPHSYITKMHQSGKLTTSQYKTLKAKYSRR